MSKGHSKRDDINEKSGGSSRSHKKAKGHGQFRSFSHPEDELAQKRERPSVFDRLGSKGVPSKSRKLSPNRSTGSKGDYGVKKVKHQSQTYKTKSSTTTSHRRKDSPRSSDESSSDDDDERSSSSSQTSSTTETSSCSSATGVTTTSSSSVPSVKIRNRKKHQLEEAHLDKDTRPEPKRYPTTEQERKDTHRSLERARSPGSRSGSTIATKRKAPPQSDDWKQGRYDQPSQQPSTKETRRRISPVTEPYHLKGRGTGSRNSEPDRDRIRIVPPLSYGSRPPPLDGPPRYSSPKPSTRLDTRNYQDFRSGREDKRKMERLAPARTPTRTDRIPPLLPEIKLRRHHETHRAFGFHRPPQPLLPERRDLPPLSSPLKLLVPKVEDPVRRRVAEWVGETVSSSPPKKVKVEEAIPVSTPSLPPPPPPLPIEEALSEISDFEDSLKSSSPLPIPIEKEELEVTSTLVEESGEKTPEVPSVKCPTTGTGGGGESPREDSILESMDFEEISEDEFEDGGGPTKVGIVDALGVDWSVLFRGKEDLDVKVKTRRRESSVVEVLKRTGLCRSLVSEELFTKVLTRLGEIEARAGISVEAQTKAEELEKPWLRRRRHERQEFFEGLGVGGSVRALSYRRDLALRKHLLGFDPSPLECFGSKVSLPVEVKSSAQ